MAFAIANVNGLLTEFFSRAVFFFLGDRECSQSRHLGVLHGLDLLSSFHLSFVDIASSCLDVMIID
jgi:hypothetical protein